MDRAAKVRGVVRACALGVIVALAALSPAPAHAYQPPDQGAAALAGEVQLDVDQFGVGGVVRPGDWCGVRVRVTDTAPKQREIVIQVSVPDADSDHVLVQREITTNPGVPQGTWMYLRLPAMFRPGDAFNVSAYEAVETPGAGLKPGRLLGTNRLISKQVVEPTTGLLAVVGPKDFGLRRYSARSQGGSASYPPFGHEVTEILSGLTPEKLPDRWMGYAPFEIVVWGQGNPGELRAERAAALKEWVRRGGHLLIVLPAVGENWTNPQASELYELMPAVNVTRREGVDLNEYRPLITFEAAARLPQGSVVYQFTRPAAVAAADAMLIMTGTKGDCVVARRLYGAGTVTLVGIDLNNRSLAEQEMLEPGVFWNRVLGRRGILPNDAQFKGPRLKGEAPARGGDVDFDTEIVGLISQQGDAATGVFLGLVVFVGYWLVAGPLSFALLKKRGWIRHSWIGFVGAGVAFTAIAWGGSTLIRPRKISADHVTIMDHVFGQPVDRARAWLSVLIPWYGTATIAVGDEKAGADRADFTNMITAWDPPTATGQVGSFPDARGYVVDARSPSKLTIPVRSTVKQIQVDWAGGPVWKMPFPVIGPDGNPEKLTAAEGVREIGDSWAKGSLTHDLPGTLKDVVIVVVPRQLALNRNGVTFSSMNSNAQAFTADEWAAGEVLDLAVVTRKQNNNDPSAAEYFKKLRERMSVTDDFQQNVGPKKKVEPVDAIKRLAGGAFYSQLEPPSTTEGGLGRGAPVARRRLTHTWDLGRWFSQPCIIIVGRLGDDKKPCPCPIPLTVNGERLPTSGTTILRWIYPLPDNPPDPTPNNAGGAESKPDDNAGGG